MNFKEILQNNWHYPLTGMVASLTLVFGMFAASHLNAMGRSYIPSEVSITFSMLVVPMGMLVGIACLYTIRRYNT